MYVRDVIAIVGACGAPVLADFSRILGYTAATWLKSISEDQERTHHVHVHAYEFTELSVSRAGLDKNPLKMCRVHQIKPARDFVNQ